MNLVCVASVQSQDSETLLPPGRCIMPGHQVTSFTIQPLLKFILQSFLMTLNLASCLYIQAEMMRFRQYVDHDIISLGTRLSLWVPGKKKNYSVPEGSLGQRLLYNIE